MMRFTVAQVILGFAMLQAIHASDRIAIEAGLPDQLRPFTYEVVGGNINPVRSQGLVPAHFHPHRTSESAGLYEVRRVPGEAGRAMRFEPSQPGSRGGWWVLQTPDLNWDKPRELSAARFARITIGLEFRTENGAKPFLVIETPSSAADDPIDAELTSADPKIRVEPSRNEIHGFPQIRAHLPVCDTRWESFQGTLVVGENPLPFRCIVEMTGSTNGQAFWIRNVRLMELE